MWSAEDVNALFKSDEIYAEINGQGYEWDQDLLSDYWHEDPQKGDIIVGNGLPAVIEEVALWKDGTYLGNDSYENYVVVKVGNQYFRKEGYYSSWDGGSLDGPWFEVEKVAKTVYEWEKKLDY